MRIHTYIHVKKRAFTHLHARAFISFTPFTSKKGESYERIYGHRVFRGDTYLGGAYNLSTLRSASDPQAVIQKGEARNA